MARAFHPASLFRTILLDRVEWTFLWEGYTSAQQHCYRYKDKANRFQNSLATLLNRLQIQRKRRW